MDLLSGAVPLGGSDRWISSLNAALSTLAGVETRLSDSVEVLGLDHQALDVADAGHVRSVFNEFRPDSVVHCAAWTAVDACESDPDRALEINATGTRSVADEARRHGTHVVYVSTDYVFDGTATSPYREADRPNPLSVYGRTKLAGESEIRPDWSIARTSWVCGYHGANMVRTALRLAQGSGTLRFVNDQHGSPTFCADLAPALALLARGRTAGIFHVTNSGATTWFDFVRAVLELAGGDPGRVQPIKTSELDPPRPAPRPHNSVLDNANWKAAGFPPMPDWREGLQRLIGALGQDSAIGNDSS